MFKMLGAAVAAVMIAAACPAGAATFVGWLNPSQTLMLTAEQLGLTSPGNWRVSWSLSGPALSFLEYEGEIKWNYWTSEGPSLQGNEIPIQDGIWDTTPQSSGSFVFQIGKPYTKVLPQDPPGVWRVYVPRISYFAFSFDGPEPLAYSITSEYVSAVPEPATWTMMIAGFGLVGSAIRRRRQAGGYAAV